MPFIGWLNNEIKTCKNAFEDLANDTKYFVLNPKDYHGKWALEVFKIIILFILKLAVVKANL